MLSRGQQLDCELKQFRLAGSGLMEIGAAMELSTIALPHAFLPLSCIANLAKNLAGVRQPSSSRFLQIHYSLCGNCDLASDITLARDNFSPDSPDLLQSG